MNCKKLLFCFTTFDSKEQVHSMCLEIPGVNLINDIKTIHRAKKLALTIPYFMSGTVSELSAIFVDKITCQKRSNKSFN